MLFTKQKENDVLQEKAVKQKAKLEDFIKENQELKQKNEEANQLIATL